jgi:hypothetical protein
MFGFRSRKFFSLWRKIICWFCLSHWDLPNHGALHNTLHTVGKLSMSKGALSWYQECGWVHGGDFIIFLNLLCTSYGILNNNLTKSILKKS